MTHGRWPTETQRRLLTAALGSGDAARQAFAAWDAEVDLDRLDGASVRLLPLLHHNLTTGRGTIDTPVAGRLRGVHRQTWYKNQLLLGVVADLLAGLAASGVPVLVLKGVPLALTAYPSPATRPMSDADLLIPAEHCPAALMVLQAAGFTPHTDGTWPPHVNAAKAFVHPDGWEIDLHTRLMRGGWGDDVDADLWRRAVPLVVNGVSTSTLSPAHHLVHVLAHGASRNQLPPIRWIADALMLVRRYPDLSWSDVVDQARRRHLVLVTRTALAYLRREFHAAVPDAVLQTLDRLPVGPGERMELRARALAGPIGAAGGLLADYARARGHSDDWQGPLGIVRYARDRMRLHSAWQVPAAVGRRLIGRRRRAGQAPDPRAQQSVG